MEPGIGLLNATKYKLRTLRLNILVRINILFKSGIAAGVGNNRGISIIDLLHNNFRYGNGHIGK